MKTLLRLEEFGLTLLAIVLFTRLPYAWWVFPLWLLAPDIGMVGYLGGRRLGSITYNLTHHRALAALIYCIGILYHIPVAALIGLIMLGHASLDRLLGYGLKYPDSFQHTHLGWIGGREEDR